MSTCTESAGAATLAQGPAHAVASLAHGLAHEVAALMEAESAIDAMLRRADQSLATRKNVSLCLSDLIDARKARIESLGAQVAGHA